MSDLNLENLYRYEGGGTFIGNTTNPSAYLNVGATGINMADVGVVVGGVISASASICNVTGGENVRLELDFYTGSALGGSIVSTFTSSYANLTTLTRVVIENVTVPATAVSFGLRIRRQSGSGEIRAHKGMVNRGSRAAPYARPFRGYSYTPMPLWANGFSRVRFLPVHVDSMFEPLGQVPITQNYNSGMSDFWEANFTTVVETAADMRRFLAWANNVGLHGLVAVRDPLQLDPGEDARTAMLNGLVNGAGQSGNTVVVTDGWLNSALVVQAGDWLEISQRYYQAQTDVTASSGGAATIPVWPRLVGVSDDQIVHINRPHLHALMLNIPELDYFQATLAQAQSLAFREYK